MLALHVGLGGGVPPSRREAERSQREGPLPAETRTRLPRGGNSAKDHSSVSGAPPLMGNVLSDAVRSVVEGPLMVALSAFG